MSKNKDNVKAFTQSVEVVDMHMHIARSEDHGKEMYSYYLWQMGVGGKDDPPCYGTVDEVKALMARSGIAHVNNLMFTWSGRYFQDAQYLMPDDPERRKETDAQLRRIITARIRDNNEWAQTVSDKNIDFSYFCGVDPVVMGEQTMLEEVADKTGRSALGVKIVPTDFLVDANDKRLWPLYDYLQANGIPLQAEAGFSPNLPTGLFNFNDVLVEFPKLKVIFSHCGYGFMLGKEADQEFLELAQGYENVTGDLSLRLPAVIDGQISPEDMVNFVREVGTDRVFYGSNFVLNELLAPRTESGEDGVVETQTERVLEAFSALPFTEKEHAGIAGKNWKAFVGLS